MKNIIKILIPWLLTSLNVYSQDPCVAEVRALYKKVSSATEGKTGSKLFYLNYSVKTTFTDSFKIPSTNSKISLWTDGSLLEVQSKEMNVYQDQHDAFVIIPEQKMVLRGDAGQGHSNRTTKLAMVQDTVFAVSKVVFCGPVAGKKGSRLLILETPEKSKAPLAVKRISFIYNTITGYFESIKITYRENASGFADAIAYVEFTFHEVSFECKNKKLDNNTSKRFLTGNQLKAEYTGYTLVDNRRKVNKNNDKHLDKK